MMMDCNASGADPELRYTGIADEPDGGAVAMLIDLPNGDQVWSGEISKDLFEQQDPDCRTELVNDFGQFVVHAEKGDARVLARCVDRWVAMDMAVAYAEWLARGNAGT